MREKKEKPEEKTRKNERGRRENFFIYIHTYINRWREKEIERERESEMGEKEKKGMRDFLWTNQTTKAEKSSNHETRNEREKENCAKQSKAKRSEARSKRRKTKGKIRRTTEEESLEIRYSTF